MKVFLTTAVICLIIFPMLYTAEAKRHDYCLTCKYFDSLNNNPKICFPVNKGYNIEIKNKGLTKPLYTAVVKAMDLGSYREEWRESKHSLNGKIFFDGWMVDLNQDGIEEAIVLPFGEFFRGASGNGDIFVFTPKLKKGSKEWKLIGILSGRALYIEPQKTNGYFDVILQWDTSAMDGYLTRCKMNKKTGRYEMVISQEYDCDIKSQETCF